MKIKIPTYIRNNAKKAALRDGYDQVIIYEKYGEYCFGRKLDGCCPDWQGVIVAEVIYYWDKGFPKTKLIVSNN